MAEKKTYKVIQATVEGVINVNEAQIPTVGDNEILVKIEAAPINPPDIMISKNIFGQKDGFINIGREGAGTVAEVGKNYAQKFKVGDKVCVIDNLPSSGCWAEYTLLPGDKVFHMNPKLTFEQAASHFVNPATATLMLRQVQKQGHKAVIHSGGASALGKMIIRLFKEHGIKTINFVRRDDMIDELKRLGADYVLNMKDDDFDKKLEEVIAKENPTKFFDAICGEFFPRILRKMPPGSICTAYGTLSEDFNINLTILDLFGQRTVDSFMVFTEISKISHEELEKTVQFIQERLDGVLSTEVRKTVSLEEAAAAAKESGDNASKGKIILKP